MSAHSLERGTPAVLRSVRASAADRLDRFAALVFGLSLAGLAALLVTNAGAVLLKFHSNLPVTEACTALVALQVAAHQLRRWRSGVRDVRHLRAVTVVFGAYVVVTLASVLWAVEPDIALEGVTQVVTDLAVVGVLIVAIRDDHDVRWIMGGLLAGAGAVALLVALQTATGNFDQTFGGFAQASVAHIAGDTDDMRSVGPYEDPNFFAQMMVSMLPLAMALVVARVNWRIRVLGAVLSVTMLATVITTFSRGALIALVAVVGATVYRHRAKRTVIATAVGLALVAILALPAEYTARITALSDVVSGSGVAGAEDPSLQGRTSEMTAAVQMFTDRPLGGVGYGNYPELYQEYSPWIGLDPRRESREPHSLYLEVASETGVLGVGILAIGLALARARIVRARRQLQAIGAGHGLLMLDALGLALVAFLMTSVFLHGAYPRVFWLLFGLALIAPWPLRLRRAGEVPAEVVS